MTTLAEYIEQIGGTAEDLKKWQAVSVAFKDMATNAGLVSKEDGDSLAESEQTVNTEAVSEIGEAFAAILAEIRDMKTRVKALEDTNRADAVHDLLGTPGASLKSLIKQLMNQEPTEVPQTQNMQSPRMNKDQGNHASGSGPHQVGLFNDLLAGQYDKTVQEGSN